MRLLFARVGKRHCINCGRKLLKQFSHMLARTLFNIPSGGFVELQGGKVSEMGLEKRVTVSGGTYDIRELTSIVEKLYSEGKGVITVFLENREFRVSQNIGCPYCDELYFKLTPSNFSYNSPEGMCKECNGLGGVLKVDEEKVINKPEKSLLDGASSFLGDMGKFRKNPNANWMRGSVIALAEALKVNLESPWNGLPEDFRNKVLYGTAGESYIYSYKSGKTGRSGNIERPVNGVINDIKRLLNNSPGKSGNNHFMKYTSEEPCPLCKGERLSREGRYTNIGEIRYPEVASLTVDRLLQWVDNLDSELSIEESFVAKDIKSEI